MNSRFIVSSASLRQNKETPSIQHLRGIPLLYTNGKPLSLNITQDDTNCTYSVQAMGNVEVAE
jgi:hypothetical protein